MKIPKENITYNTSQTKFYYILMSQKDLLENQVIEEILRERVGNYISRNKIIDFWIVNSPKFIDNDLFQKKLNISNFYKKQIDLLKINKESNNLFLSSLITTNYEFIKWLQLRLGYFENVEDLLINKENDKFNNKIYFNSDGIYGQFNDTEFLVEKNDFSLHPDILKYVYIKSLN